MKDKMIRAHMQAAKNYALCSSAVRLKVGAIVVKDDRIISIGYNGQPSGWDNVCETKEWMPEDAGAWASPEEIETQWPLIEGDQRYRLKTLPTVLHAESNAIAKLARSSESGLGSAIFITHSPCIDCAKMIYQSGIKEVYYAVDYRSKDGIEFLEKCGILVKKVLETD
jgi:dCMP deaminase